jgi:hypothetical protein
MFSSREKVLLLIAVLGLVAVCIGYMIDFFTGGDKIGEYIASGGEGIAEVAVLILLIQNGTLMSTSYWKPLLVSGLVVLTSFVMTMLHVPYSMELWFLGIIAIESLYTIRFIRKASTPVLDWFKYSWICSRCVFSTAVFFHVLEKEYELIPVIVFWLTLALFVSTRPKWIGEGRGNY